MSINDENELLQAFKIESTKHYAFNNLMLKYREMLYFHIRRILIIHEDTDDVLQNTWIKVWHHLEKFRGESSLKTWLYRIATNESISFLKRKKTLLFIPILSVEKELSKSIEDDVYFNGNEIEKKLQKAILTLPEKQRLVFNMRYFEEMPYEEISSVLGTSVGALKASYHIAMNKIEKILTAN